MDNLNIDRDAEIAALRALLGWYENEMERYSFDEDSLPEELVELEQRLREAEAKRYGN